MLVARGTWRMVAAVAVTVMAAGTMSAVATVTHARPAAALDNGLALTPYMGWNTYYGLGTKYNEQTIVNEAQAMVSRGLEKAGYQYVWLDGGWWSGARNADGTMAPNPSQWPHGMAWLTAYIHSLGLKAGIYT
ncbi:MAG: glycoside hydrolase family 27 protein, partial [Pseudonocardiaceae bacterium]